MRSPLTETIYKVQGMIAYVRDNLSTDEFMLFLDLLVPEPEAKPAKKTRKKTPRRVKDMSCIATLHDGVPCRLSEAHAFHNDKNNDDFHQYQAGKKSARAAGLSEQLSGRRQERSAAPNICVAELPNGTGICHQRENDALHTDSSYGNYHEFYAGKSAASPAPNPSPANGAGGATTANSETGKGAAQAVAGGGNE